MKSFAAWILRVVLIVSVTGCSPVKTLVTNQYKLDAYSNCPLSSVPTSLSILISPTDAVHGYQTDQMLYVKKPFEINNFAQNNWISAPADMLYPLILQSIQNSGFFKAVSSSPNAEQTDYRLDTQLIELQQNFIKKPSEITLSFKAVLSNVTDSRIIASRMFIKRQRCPYDTPYGGVIAANIATKQLTAELTSFTIHQVKQDKN